MVRKALMHILLLCAISLVAQGTVSAQEKVRDDVAPQISTLSLGQLILRDSFDDNKMASMWDLYTSDVNTCWVAEVNNRLEVRATSAANDAFAGYVANAWRLDPRGDFNMKVNFHIEGLTYSRGAVSFGITTDSRNPRDQWIGIHAQCVNLWKSFRSEYKNGNSVESSTGERLVDEGTLYISYTAADDIIYLSAAGYGASYASVAYPGVLQGQWAGRPVYLFVGGGSSGLEIRSGAMYLDNLEVETGTVVESSLQKVYRFKSVQGECHFYTMSELEKEKLLTKCTDAWTYVGVAFYAFPENSDADCKPVYRFWNGKLGSHFFTLSEDEKSRVQSAGGWTYEGIAFYAYPADTWPDWTHPVYRFWSGTYGSHLYTIDEAEKAKLINDSSNLWTYEGIAWYAVE